MSLAGAGPLYCSVLTVSELLRLLRQPELVKTRRLLDTLVPLPVLYEDAVLAAELLRHRGPGFVDCHIAATAIRRNLHLVTYNAGTSSGPP